MANKTSILSVKIVGDSKGLRRSLNHSASAVDSFSKKVSRITGSAASFGKIAGQIALIGTAVAGAVSSIGTLSVALAGAGKFFATLAGASLALPGILAGMAVGAGVLYAALVDTGDVLGDLGPKFGALQDAISARFWSAAADPIREMVNTLLPALQTGLTSVAASLGRWTADLANAVKVAASGDGLALFFARVAQSIDIARAGLAPMITGLGALFSAGAAYLPQLAQWFVDISNRFAEWTQQITTDGSLQTWVTNGVAAIGSLIAVLGSIVSIIGSVAQAASQVDGVGMAGLGAAIHQVAAALQTPALQQWMVTGFTLAAQTVQTAVGALVGLLGALTPLLAPLASLWTSGLQVAQALTGMLVPALRAFATAIAPAVTAVAGLISQFAAQIGSNTRLQAAMVTLGTTIGTAVTNAVRVLIPLVSALIPVFAQIVTYVGQNADKFLALSVAIMGGVAAWRAVSVATRAYAAVAGVVRGVMAGVTAATAAYRAGLTLKTAALVGASAAQRALNIAMKANPIGIVISLVAALAAGLVYFFTQTKAGQQAWAAFTSFLSSALGAANAFINSALQQLGAWWDSRVQAMRAGWEAFITGLRNGLQSFMTATSTILNSVKSFFTSAFQVIGSVAKGAFNVIQGALKVLLGVFRGDVNLMRDGFKQGFSAIESVGRSVLNAIKGFFNAPVEGARKMMDWLGKLPGPFRHLQGVAKAVTGSISRGLEQVAGFARRVQDALGGTVNGVKKLLGMGGTGFTVSGGVGDAFSLSLARTAGSHVGASGPLGLDPRALALGTPSREVKRAETEDSTERPSVVYNITTNNPLPETPSETLRKNNRTLALMGL